MGIGNNNGYRYRTNTQTETIQKSQYFSNDPVQNRIAIEDKIQNKYFTRKCSFNRCALLLFQQELTLICLPSYAVDDHPVLPFFQRYYSQTLCLFVSIRKTKVKSTASMCSIMQKQTTDFQVPPSRLARCGASKI